MRKKFVVLILLILMVCSCQKTEFMSEYFDKNKINGTVIISSLNTGKEYIYNSERSEQRFLPASTFKVLNTLIALQENIVADEYDIVNWDGQDKGLKEWNKDQCIATALPESCVWFYQELARRVGLEKYNKYLTKLGYGNEKTGKMVDTFWLEGDLRISTREQIDFLKNVYNETYSFDERNYRILKEAMIVDDTPEYVLRSKTGWALRANPQIGWYIGYIETSDDVWFFACNLDIIDKSYSKYRKEIVYNALEELKIIK
ncbi:class D beta-lactamase [Maledivibacter halophilus]|uniref:Beta-lactamase n=1 Tax=Maledivibacter halophilus TaxID=36842 RepID=A0A1T5M1I5_9FIRM|nr:class D beta-lactamase [Maledivibacter halophilus]SKC82086.1 beta-lactamase class D [Maledivibacter halophilus]